MTSASAARSLSARFPRALRLQRAGVVYALVIIVVCFQLLTVTKGLPAFLSVPGIRNVVDLSALDGILAISMTVLLISGNFDLSVGATAGLAGAVGMHVANAHGSGLGTLAAIGIGIGIGVVNGVLVQVVGVNAFIVTLGTLTAVQGLLLIITNGNTVLAKSGAFGSIGTGTWHLILPVAVVAGTVLILYAIARATGLPRRQSSRKQVDGSVLTAGLLGLAVIVAALASPGLLSLTRPSWIMLLYMTAAALVLRFTVVGRRLYAVGGNSEASLLSGIGVARYKISPFILTSVSASLVGLLYAGKFGAVEPTALVNEELPVLAAAILGGTSLFGGSGYVVKSVVGALILAGLTTGFNVLNLGANYQYLVQGMVIIAAAAVYTVAGRRRRAATTAPEPVPATASDEGAGADHAQPPTVTPRAGT